MINAMETSGTSPSNTSNQCATSGTSPSGTSSPAVSIQPEAPNTPTPYSTQAAYLASVTADVTASITAAHEKFALAEKAFARDYGIAYGKVLFLARKKLADAGYGQLSNLLDNLSIPRSTAYFWINKYEISEGIRQPKEEKPYCPAEVGLSEPTSQEVNGVIAEYETEELAPASPRTKGFNERRQNRTKPVETESAVLELARRIIDAGYKALLAAGENKSHLYAAKTLAKTKLDLEI